MTRLRIPISFTNIIIELFSNRTNQIFTNVGTTDSYDVLIGIDQGEVISPLLWCIYYDPLLCKIQRSDLGYTVTHTYPPDIRIPHQLKTVSEQVPVVAYMDDTNWFATSPQEMSTILNIADSYYKFTNIKVNHKKAVLITNAYDNEPNDPSHSFLILK